MEPDFWGELLLRNAAYRPAQKAQEQERRLVEASTFEQARHGRTDDLRLSIVMGDPQWMVIFHGKS